MSENESIAKQVSEGLLGLAIIGTAVWFGWGYLFPGGEYQQSGAENSQPSGLVDQHSSLDLAGYADFSEDERAALVAALSGKAGLPKTVHENMVACVGDYAYTKSSSLKLSNVHGWCRDEYQRGDDRFETHFNELAADDLSSHAAVFCRDRVRDKLASPSSADFPWVPDQVMRQPRQSYYIRSQFDADNAFGASIRLTYICQIKHDLEGDPYDINSWQFGAVEIHKP